LKDNADPVMEWECKIRDDKWCLRATSKWCDGLKRCIKKSSYCKTYNPKISSSIKNALEPLISNLSKKIEEKYNDSENRLKAIDFVSIKLDQMILKHYKYKAILYYVIQKIESKRIKYLK
jgi:hypothetical protein